MSFDVLDKVRKLLRLAQSPNANEAALAAAKAQRLIDEHHLQTALLALETHAPDAAADEPIVDFASKGAPLERATARLERWRVCLADVVARANACRIYLSSGSIALVGRPSDADSVRYLYEYLTREVERLCDLEGRGCGRTWRNNYRLGVVDAITLKLQAMRQQFAADAREQAAGNSTALVLMNQALARVEQRGRTVETWTKTHLKLRAGRAWSARGDYGARAAGQRAGRSIAINNARGGLPQGRRALAS